MILIYRAERRIEISEISSALISKNAGGNYQLFAMSQFCPTKKECVDLVESGRCVVRIFQKKLEWYGVEEGND